MKKILGLVSLLTLSLVLFGCGNDFDYKGTWVGQTKVLVKPSGNTPQRPQSKVKEFTMTFTTDALVFNGTKAEVKFEVIEKEGHKYLSMTDVKHNETNEFEILDNDTLKSSRFLLKRKKQ